MIWFPPHPQISISNRPSKAPSCACLPAGPGPAWRLTAFGGCGQLGPLFSKNNFGNGIKKPKKGATEEKEEAALSLPSPARLTPLRAPGEDVSCPRCPTTAPGLRRRTQRVTTGHRTCKRPVSSTGHQLRENAFVKFRSSLFSLLLPWHRKPLAHASVDPSPPLSRH